MEFLFFLISLSASAIGAVSGIGGGIIIKPILDMTGFMTVSTINFLSGITVLIMSSVSLIRNRNNEVVLDKRRSTPLAVGAALGGIIGKWAFDAMKQSVSAEYIVSAVQEILLLLITISVLSYVRFKNRLISHHVANFLPCLIIGLALGVLSSFLGIGGGPLNIGVLYFFFSMDAKTSAKNSLYMIWFSQMTNLLLTLVSGTVPDFSWLVLILMGLGGVLGSLIGSRISRKVQNAAIEKIFMGLLIFIIGINVYNIVSLF